jgi:hypothetical protein
MLNETQRDLRSGMWARQPNESIKGFDAFRIYWELGRKRSLAGVTAVLTARKNGEGGVRSDQDARQERKNVKSGQVGLWSRKHHWKQRAEAWDVEATRYREQRRAREVWSMWQRHVKQIRWVLALIYQVQDEFDRAIRDERNDFKRLDAFALLKLCLPALRLLIPLQKGQRDALGVKVVIPKSRDGVRSVPEWHIQQLRIRPGFDENADSAFERAGGELGGTAEHFEKQTAGNSAKKAWDPQAGESARPYSAFCAYRDLGPARSLAEVTRRCVGKRTATLSVVDCSGDGSSGKRRKCGQVGVWCRKFSWVERCREWDEYQAGVYQHRLRKDLEQQAERHATEARVALEVLLIPIVRVAKSLERTREDFAKMRASQIYVLLLKLLAHLPVLQRWERRARGVEPVDPRKDRARGWSKAGRSELLTKALEREA